MENEFVGSCVKFDEKTVFVGVVEVDLEDAGNFIRLIAEIFNYKNRLVFLVNHLSYVFRPFSVSVVKIQLVSRLGNLYALQKRLPLASHLKV